MMHLLISALFLLSILSAHAQQGSITIDPKPAGDAWWLRARFMPASDTIRGVSVGKIDITWCRAMEFSTEMLPVQQIREAEKLPADAAVIDSSFIFSIVRNLDFSEINQVVLVGAYQTCDGKTGAFTLVLDEGTNRVRFLKTYRTAHQFAVLQDVGDARAVTVWACMECDNYSRLRWDQKRKAFRLSGK